MLGVGNPFGMGQTVTMGIVSALGRGDMGVVDHEDFIHADAVINPGNTGGALTDLNGELVGINRAILTRSGGYQGFGFAVPTTLARATVDQLVAHGEVRRGQLGVVNQDADLALPSRIDGVAVMDIDRGASGAAAG